jgi:aminoglycoside 3-N-acetyltransferase
MNPGYTRADFAAALRAVGVRAGDVVFSHSNVGLFGRCADGTTAAAVVGTILGAFDDVLGPAGTLAVPAFTYSACRGEPFDPARSPSTCGAFAEAVRQSPGAHRSHDPIFSVAAVGARAAALVADVPPECFGPDSFWDRFLRADGIVCNLNLDAGSTFLHYVERRGNVPYRYDKVFPGTVVLGGQPRGRSAVFYCHDLTDPQSVAAFEPFDACARARGIVRTAPVGRGALVACRATDIVAVLEDEFRTRPLLLTAGGEHPAPTPTPEATDAAPPPVDVGRVIDVVSDAADEVFAELARANGMARHSYPTGTHAWSWIVPEGWSCSVARLMTAAGDTLLDARDNPLFVARYSLPFDGPVERDDLLRHLHTDAADRDAVPYHSLDGVRNWGLCCSRAFKDTLGEPTYRVEIRTRFRRGALRVAEAVVPGERDEWVLVAASPSGPGLADHGWGGVRTALELLNGLRAGPPGRLTYRILLVPERYGLPAFLSHHEHLLPGLKAALWLGDMSTDERKFELQLSRAGNTSADVCLSLAARECVPGARIVPYGTFATTEVGHLNAPTVGVPMLAVRGGGAAGQTPADVIGAMLEALDHDRVYAPLYRGDLCLARAGLHTHPDPDGVRRLLNHLDGRHSTAALAAAAGMSFADARAVLACLEVHRMAAPTDSLGAR